MKKVFRFLKGFSGFLRFLGFNVRTVARGHWAQEYDHEEGLHED